MKYNKNKSIKNPYQYTGRRYDEETDQYYYRARMYSAEQCRFTSEDTAGMVDGPNMYAYVGNNPVNKRDPSGKYAPQDVIDGGGGGLELDACSNADYVHCLCWNVFCGCAEYDYFFVSGQDAQCVDYCKDCLKYNFNCDEWENRYDEFPGVPEYCGYDPIFKKYPSNSPECSNNYGCQYWDDQCPEC